MATGDPADAVTDPVLRESLTSSAAVGLTGVLQVIGDPGGTVYLSGGEIIGIKTPGAPSLEVLVLKSGRVPEDGWEAAFSAAAAGTTMSAELITRGLIGAGELEALLRTAVADALFVLACGYVDQCRPEPGPVSVLLPLDPPAEAAWLLAEAERRMNALAAIPGLTGYQRARVQPAPGVVPADLILGGGRDELLALANGRRTPRDLAFALGRGVYATTLELGRMQHEGLLVTTSHRAAPSSLATPQASTAPASTAPAKTVRAEPAPATSEPANSEPVADHEPAEPAAASEPAPPAEATNGDRPGGHGLTRRRRGRHGDDAGADMSMLLRLLRPRSSGD
jgi:pyruvate/2-oxoglutarate dehydrogenase complex dihydrolipoamide acyltransferase (E2) component